MNRRKLSSIAIELTASCNQKCDYCYNEWREDGGKTLHGGCSSDEQGRRSMARVERSRARR
jgi:MoaA/NifB/PqqE/SkfB family radical SAM enzyme